MTWLISILSGGLAGGCVSTFLNRWFHRRDMRVKFYPILNNIYSAYVIRFEKPQGRYWLNVVGQIPSPQDQEFVEHRSHFICYDLIEYNELREVRKLRKTIVENQATAHTTPGILHKLDLATECEALGECLATLHKKLNID
jgi:hypothetical protein